METVLVGISRLITVASLPVLCYRVLTIETSTSSILTDALIVLVFMIALAITVRAEICEQERERRKRR